MVVSNDNEKLEVLVLKFTTSSPRTAYDYQLKDLSCAGLKKPTVVRCDKMAIVSEKQISKKIGTISETDYEAIYELYTKTS